MRWLVVLLVALLIGLAWLLVDADPPPVPAAPPIASAPPSPPAPEVREAPVPDEPAPAAPATVDSPASLRVDETPAEPGAVFVVVDEAGRPLEGATVQATAGERDLATERTDAQGIATLRRVPPNAGHRVRRAGSWPVAGDGCIAGTTTRIVLQSAPQLTGAVFDAAGAPVAGARVLLLSPFAGRRGAPASRALSAMDTVSDAGGRFIGQWPDAGTYDLIVEARGHAPGVVLEVRHATHGAGPIIVSLRAGATLTGVVRRADGVPLVDVRVDVHTVGDGPPKGVAALGPPLRLRKGQALATTTSVARGEFVLQDLPAVPVVVTLASEHAAAAVYTALVEGQTTELELRAAENAAVIGDVQNGGVEPVSVFLYGGTLRDAQTVDGGFVFLEVPPGRYLIGAAPMTSRSGASQIAAVIQEYLVRGSTTLAATIDLAPGEQRQIVLPAPAAARGRVLGSASVAGSPAADHVVALEPLDGVGAHRREGTVGADGTFRVADVPPGDYDARLRAPGSSKVLAEARCRVRAGDDTPVTLAAP